MKKLRFGEIATKGMITINKYRLLAKDTLIFGIGNIGSKLIVFFLVPLYTSYLSKSDYGNADYLISISQLIIPFSSLVIFDSVLRFGLDNTQNIRSVMNCSLVVWITGNLITFSSVLLMDYYNIILGFKWYLALYISLNILFSIQLNYLKANGENTKYSLICIIYTVLLCIFNIIFLKYLSYGIEGYLMSYLYAHLLTVLIAGILGNMIESVSLSLFDYKLLRNMVIFSLPLVFNNLGYWLLQSSNRIITQLLLGDEMLALIAVASRIPSIIFVFITIFEQAWGIAAIREYNNENSAYFYSNILYVMTTFVFLVCLFLNTNIKYFMKFYVSEAYYEVWIYIPLLVVAAGISSIASYVASMYLTLKMSFQNMKSTLIAGIVCITSCFFLVRFYSLWGVVYSTLMTYIFLSFYRFISISKYLELKFIPKLVLVNILLCIIHAVFVIKEMDFYYYIVPIVLVFVFINKRCLFNVIKLIIKSK